MSKIFISYSRKDSEFRRRLDSSLLKLNYSVWVDIREIESGNPWSSDVQKGLDQCSVMLVIMSPNSMNSQNVIDEWEYFLDTGKPLIPILWQPTKKHYRLHNRQHIDFHEQTYEVALRQLCDELLKKEIKTTSVTSNMKLTKVANIFWICHDLMELNRWLQEGISKQWIDIGFRQSRHHAIEIGLDGGIISKIEQLIQVTKVFSDQDWNEANRRQQYAREVTILFNVIAQEIQAGDPDFNSGPG